MKCLNRLQLQLKHNCVDLALNVTICLELKFIITLLFTYICIFSTILLGYQAKMVRIGLIVALADTHFCILSRDCFNLSREYFSLWVIKNVTG